MGQFLIAQTFPKGLKPLDTHNFGRPTYLVTSIITWWTIISNTSSMYLAEIKHTTPCPGIIIGWTVMDNTSSMCLA